MGVTVYSNLLDLRGIAAAGTVADPWGANQWRANITGGGPVASSLYYQRGVYDPAGASTWLCTNDNLTFDGWDALSAAGRDLWGLVGAVDFLAGAFIIGTNFIWKRAAFNTITITFDPAVAGQPHPYSFRVCYFSSPLTVSLGSTRNTDFTYRGCTFNCPKLDINYTGNLISFTFDWCLFNETIFQNNDRNATIVCNNCTFVGRTEAAVRRSVVAGSITFNNCTFSASLLRELPDDISEMGLEDLRYSQFGLPWTVANSGWGTGDYDHGFRSESRQGPGAFYFGILAAEASASPSSGKGPLDVEFSGNTEEATQGFEWDFGDGHTSGEQNPTHTYEEPGEYEVTYTTTDALGNTSTSTITVYVYDNDYGSGYIVNRTDYCARFAVPQEPGQGVGWAEYMGDDWPFPLGKVGTVEVLDDVDDRRPLVMDSETFLIHELARTDQWQDGEGDYSGSEQEAEILFPEVTPPIGASAKVSHNQTNVWIKPWYKDRRNTGDYGEDGFRTGFNMDVFIRQGSTAEDAAVARRVPVEGQIVHDRHLHDKSLQIGLRPRVAPWRVPKVQMWVEQDDTAASPPNKLMSEMEWALELGEPQLWISRYSPDMSMNLATGIASVGSWAGVTAGPDGKVGSAVAFGITDLLTTAIPTETGASDLTFMFWVRGPSCPINVLTFGDLTIALHLSGDHYEVQWDDGSDHREIVLASDLAEWTLITVIRRGTDLIVYENMSLANTAALADQNSYSGNATIGNGVVTLFDVRVLYQAISEETIEYVYRDVIQNHGDAICKVFL